MIEQDLMGCSLKNCPWTSTWEKNVAQYTGRHFPSILLLIGIYQTHFTTNYPLEEAKWDRGKEAFMNIWRQSGYFSSQPITNNVINVNMKLLCIWQYEFYYRMSFNGIIVGINWIKDFNYTCEGMKINSLPKKSHMQFSCTFFIWSSAASWMKWDGEIYQPFFEFLSFLSSLSNWQRNSLGGTVHVENFLPFLCWNHTIMWVFPSVCLSVCSTSPQPFIDRSQPNLALLLIAKMLHFAQFVQVRVRLGTPLAVR